MLLFRVLAVFASAVALNACQTSSPDASSAKEINHDQDGYPALPECSEGESPLIFQLVAGETLERSDIGLSGPIENLHAQKENDARGYRFDLCFNESSEEVRLKRIVRRQPQISAFNTKHVDLVPETFGESAAWSEAIALGGSAALEVRIRDTSDAKRSVLVKGWKRAEGKAFVTVSTFDWNGADPLAATSSEVTYGSLVEGNPWIAKFRKNDRLIETGALRIELRYEVKDGANNYKTYSVQSVRIVDKNAGLGQPFDQTLSGAALTEALEIDYTHHSLLDQFIIKLPHAQYRIGQGLKVDYVGTIAPIQVDLQCLEVSDCGQPL